MVSIIIPTLNEIHYLPRLLDSIRSQNYNDYEIIVADAGSTDGTQALAQIHGCRVVAGGSPGKGRNEGARVAKGSHLLFLDADAVLPKGFLSSFLKKFEKRNCKVAGCALSIDEQGMWFRIGERLWNGYFWITQRFYPHATNCFMATKEVHEKIKGFNEAILLGEEFDYIRKGARIGKFAFFMTPIFIASARRVKKEGMIRTFFTYAVAEILMTFRVNITSSKFPYRFHTYSREKKDDIS